MKMRLKLLAAVALLGIPLAACEETTPPPPVGSIVGTVSIEGTGIDGISVNLSNGNSATTSGGGSYRFDNVEGGAYTVTISGFPSDATFDATSAAATISSAGQSVTVNFSGAYIRTASVMGTVTVENMGLGGVTVALSGVSSASATTDDNGQYAFTGLRMGNYSVEISGFDSDEVGFSATAAAVTVGVGESKIISFDGTYLRTAGIMGRVSVEGEGLEGVTVSLSGGPDATDMTTMTDAAGQYSFAKLRAGDYAVGISGYNTDDYEFEVTSQNVTVALGETANVPFEGILLRTAGVSGRVSVEGIGLEGVMVTLSMTDAEDMTAMTDAGGLYAFAGLAAGDYTVAIALSEEQMAAYVFDMTSMDVTLEDDMTSIVNFEGTHDTSASVTVRLFVDEGPGGRNDMHDEGEPAFPSAEMIQMVAAMGLSLPLETVVSLAGPGVHDRQEGMTMQDGSVVFSGLTKGDYQVIVTDIPAEVLAALPPALAHVLRDYAYGGPATGYMVELGVGETPTQYAPVDITHTTVHFGVTLKLGEERGMPLPGAAVTLYSDAMGEDMVGQGMTMVNEESGHAVASIRIAREETPDDMVYAGVEAEGYDVAAGMTPVPWDPQMTSTIGGNANDIVNLNVDVTVAGATITTDYGGGDALAGWALGIMAGDAAVEGDDVPPMLDDDGMAAFTATVDSAGALPVTYTFAVAEDQDDDLDGGESFEANSVEYEHKGLSLAGTVDLDPIVVAYTTQTLKVYTHWERDQVDGYTGSVLARDQRASGVLDLSIRYIDGAGRARSFTGAEWNAAANTQFEDDVTLSSGAIIRGHGEAGLVIFSHLPAGHDVIVRADLADATANLKIIDPDELATFRNRDENRFMGGAFGDMGGFNHTVELCPLMATEPTEQYHGECGSFAFVATSHVFGQAWTNQVVVDATGDGFIVRQGGQSGPTQGRRAVPGTTFTMDPVEGRNLAGVSKSYTAKTTDTPRGGIDDRKQFDFGQMASGIYALGVPDGWRATLGGPDDAGGLASRVAYGPEIRLHSGGSVYQIDITPTTGILYGKVTDDNGFAVEDATVSVNNVSVMTDSKGRYIAAGVEYVTGFDGRPTPTEFRNEPIVAIAASKDGFTTYTDTLHFGPTVNNPTPHDVDLSGVTNSIMITGKVTDILTGDGIGRVEVEVDGEPPLNREKRSWHPDFNKLLTAEDGTYSAQIRTKARGQTASVTIAKDDYHFPVDASPVLADGNSPAVVNFQGYENGVIMGTVQDPEGDAMAGVTITATSTGEPVYTATDETNSVGQFRLSVPPVSTYRLVAEADGVTFEYPNNNQTTFAGPGQTVNFGRIKAMTFMPRGVTASRVYGKADDTSTTEEGDSITVVTENTVVSWTRGAPPAGFDTVLYVVQRNTGTAGAFEDVTETVNATDDPVGESPDTIGSTPDTEHKIRVLAVAAVAGATEGDTLISAEVTVDAVDPSPSSDAAARVGDTIQVSWDATTNANSEFRVVAEVSPASLGGARVWVVLSGDDVIDDSVREWNLLLEAGFAAADYTVVGGTQTVNITLADLEKALMVRVDARQEGVDDANDWPEEKQGTARLVPLKPTG